MCIRDLAALSKNGLKYTNFYVMQSRVFLALVIAQVFLLCIKKRLLGILKMRGDCDLVGSFHCSLGSLRLLLYVRSKTTNRDSSCLEKTIDLSAGQGVMEAKKA